MEGRSVEALISLWEATSKAAAESSSPSPSTSSSSKKGRRPPRSRSRSPNGQPPPPPPPPSNYLLPPQNPTSIAPDAVIPLPHLPQDQNSSSIKRYLTSLALLPSSPDSPAASQSLPSGAAVIAWSDHEQISYILSHLQNVKRVSSTSLHLIASHPSIPNTPLIISPSWSPPPPSTSPTHAFLLLSGFSHPPVTIPPSTSLPSHLKTDFPWFCSATAIPLFIIRGSNPSALVSTLFDLLPSSIAETSPVLPPTTSTPTRLLSFSPLINLSAQQQHLPFALQDTWDGLTDWIASDRQSLVLTHPPLPGIGPAIAARLVTNPPPGSSVAGIHICDTRDKDTLATASWLDSLVLQLRAWLHARQPHLQTHDTLTGIAYNGVPLWRQILRRFPRALESQEKALIVVGGSEIDPAWDRSALGVFAQSWASELRPLNWLRIILVVTDEPHEINRVRRGISAYVHSLTTQESKAVVSQWAFPPPPPPPPQAHPLIALLAAARGPVPPPIFLKAVQKLGFADPPSLIAQLDDLGPLLELPPRDSSAVPYVQPRVLAAWNASTEDAERLLQASHGALALACADSDMQSQFPYAKTHWFAHAAASAQSEILDAAWALAAPSPTEKPLILVQAGLDAAAVDSVAGLKWIQDQGFSLDTQDESHRTPIWMAAVVGSAHAAEYLLDKVRTQKWQDQTSHFTANAVERAAWEGHVHILELFHKYLPAHTWLNTSTVLHAASGGSVASVEWCISHYSPIKLLGNTARQLVHRALTFGHAKLAKWLFDSGTITRKSHTYFMGASHPASFAAPNLDVLKLLHRTTSPSWITSSSDLYSHLSTAGHLPSLKWLVDDLRVPIGGGIGRSLEASVIHALSHRHDDIVAWLIKEKGATVKVPSRLESLKAAAYRGNLSCLKWILSAPVLIADKGYDVRESMGFLLVKEAARAGHVELMQFLVLDCGYTSHFEEDKWRPFRKALILNNAVQALRVVLNPNHPLGNRTWSYTPLIAVDDIRLALSSGYSTIADLILKTVGQENVKSYLANSPSVRRALASSVASSQHIPWATRDRDLLPLSNFLTAEPLAQITGTLHVPTLEYMHAQAPAFKLEKLLASRLLTRIVNADSILGFKAWVKLTGKNLSEPPVLVDTLHQAFASNAPKILTHLLEIKPRPESVTELLHGTRSLFVKALGKGPLPVSTIVALAPHVDAVALNHRRPDHGSPLHVLARKRQAPAMLALVKAGADLNAPFIPPSHMDRPMFTLIAEQLKTRREPPPELYELLALKPEGLLDRNSSGETLLHLAAAQDSVMYFNWLLDNTGLTLESTNLNGKSCLEVALECDSRAVLNEILLRSPPEAINSSSGLFSTPPLLLGLMSSNANACLLLLSAGADPHARLESTGDTGLHLAARRSRLAVVRALLAAGANEYVDAQNHEGMTPLHWAAKSGSTAIINMLVEAGSRAIDTPNRVGQTPLHLAVSEELIHVVYELLVNHNSKSINTADVIGQTPMTIASALDPHEAVRMQQLLKKYGGKD